jgi:transcriptional regulator with XRE-family HTH domain
MTSIEIGARIKEVRKQLDLTQAQMGARLDVTRNTQANYETGERAPDAIYIARLAALNGVDALYVVTGKTSATALSAKEVELLAAYRKAGKSKRMALEAFLKSMEVLP